VVLADQAVCDLRSLCRRHMSFSAGRPAQSSATGLPVKIKDTRNIVFVSNLKLAHSQASLRQAAGNEWRG